MAKAGRKQPSAYWQMINKRRWTTVRLRVLDRDGWRCRKCGRAGRLEVDHITPLADGGQLYDMGNLQPLCRACHFAKTAGENTARNPAKPEVAAWRELVMELVVPS